MPQSRSSTPVREHAGSAPLSPPTHAAPIDRRTQLGLHQALVSFARGIPPVERAALASLVQLASMDRSELLGALRPASILSPVELETYEALAAGPRSFEALAAGQLVVVMKATRLCNLRCSYCHSWREGPGQVMEFAVLCRATRDALAMPGPSTIEFVWHGGEVSLLPVTFFQKAVWLQQRFRRPQQRILNSVQTNATLRNDAVFEFFRDHGFGVGVSLDGPPEVHDRRRINKAGRPTSGAVRAGLERLRAMGVPFAALAVIDSEAAKIEPARLLEYFASVEATGLGVLNVIPDNNEARPSADCYISWPVYIHYLCDLFREWWERYRDRLRIREFDELLSALQGTRSGLCYFSGNCMGRFITIEPNGDVAACDKYVGDRGYHFGNLSRTPLADLLKGSRSLAAHALDQSSAQDRMRRCSWFEICQGGCPHDRRLNRRHLVEGYNGGCCGYAPLIEQMALALRRRAAPH